MKLYTCTAILIALLVCACSGQKDADREYTAPDASKDVVMPLPSDSVAPDKTPIDLGDVDSGIFINGQLAKTSESVNVTVENIETMRGTLSMTTITVKPPFPDTLFVEFEVAPSRSYEERPVVLRARAYRDETAPLGEEHAYVLGKDAKAANSADGTRIFSVNVLDGLTEVPDTLLVFAKADAWLMEAGTSEELLDPMTATSPDRVSIMSNPVRINFVKEEAAL